MSVRQISDNQPDSFEFTEQNLVWAKEQIKKYPEGKQASAVIPLLWRAQEQHDGWLPKPAINYVAEMLGMAPIRVMEVATFYTMFNLAPVGKYFIQLCGTTPCLLRGSDALVEVLKKRVGDQNHVTSDGLFSWLEVECLGACANAPMVQINKDYFEDLTAEKFETLLDDLEAGRDVTSGPQNGRSCSCPEGGATSLTDEALYRGKDDVASAGIVPLKAAALSNFVNNGDGQQAEIPSASADEETIGDDGEVKEEFKPEGLSKARNGEADDLKRIKGVGPKLEETLHALGIFHFDQIANWNKDNVSWVDDYLSFKGRIDREDWISQAKVLADEISTDEKKGDV
jgi:NADH-quinone oxidoreductase subunit E